MGEKEKGEGEKERVRGRERGRRYKSQIKSIFVESMSSIFGCRRSAGPSPAHPLKVDKAEGNMYPRGSMDEPNLEQSS